MTELEQRAARALGRVHCGENERDRGFCAWAAALVTRHPSRDMHARGRKWLWRLVWRYRKQISDAELVAVAQIGGEDARAVAAQSTQRAMFL